MAHKHQKVHTVPKQVSPLEKNVMVLQSENCTVLRVVLNPPGSFE